MAIDTVTNNSDDEATVSSLRYELAHAKSGDIINFDPSVTSIKLSSALFVTTNLTIEGSQPDSSGTPGVTIDGQNQTVDFLIYPGVATTFDGLTIANGQRTASKVGGIDDLGNLTLSNSVLAGNYGGFALGSPGETNYESLGGRPGAAAFGAIYVRYNATLNLVGTTNAFIGNKARGGSGDDGGASYYHVYAGGKGGAGAYAADGMAKTPATAGSKGQGPYGGAGGAPYGVGLDGRSYGGGGDGPGGGGGGGNAFADYGGGGIVNVIAVCYAPGTRIRTVRGDIAVEALSVGDLVVTASGAHRPIRWLGHRTIDCRAASAPANVLPVRVAARAFGGGLPERDLFLSPGHPVLVGADENNAGGHLVPIMCLINGTTIDRVTVESVTYWHVELDQHDILLAEGLPAESYLDWGDRSFFTEGTDHALANPDFVVPGLGARCRPVAVAGALVEAERRRLDAMFAMRLASACAWPDDEALDVSARSRYDTQQFASAFAPFGTAELLYR